MSYANKKISFFIVDDDNEVLKLIKREINLKLKDVLIFSANSGSETLQKLRLATPNLLIIDVKMPKMGGCEVIDFLQKEKKKYDFPIICITGLSPNDLELGPIKELGVPILHKPFKVSELIALAKQELNKFQSSKK